MKKLSVLLLILLLMPFRAWALIECDCGMPSCICFIQRGDEGIPVKAVTDFLAERGYLRAGRSAFDGTVYEAVCDFQKDEGLEVTGVLDDETLTRLIWRKSVEEMDAQDEDGGSLVYVPTDGGKKRHAKPSCSGMEDLRKISVRNAQAFEMEACKRCKPL